MRKITVICMLLPLVLTCHLSAAQIDNLPELKTTVKTLAVFKNGLGFAGRVGSIGFSEGWCVLDEVPQAALGTLWIGTTTSNCRVEEVISYQADDQRDVNNIAEILEANIGKEVEITLSRGSEIEELSGTILSAPVGQIVLIRTDSGSTMAINKGSVQSVGVSLGTDLNTKLTILANRLKLRLASNLPAIGGRIPNSGVSLSYLEKGIIWSPSYLINIADKKEAEITMEAILANDAEDLEDVDVSFVVGYPNFIFADQISPLSTEQSVADFIERLTNGSPNSSRRIDRSRVICQSIAYNWAAGETPATMPGEPMYSTARTMPGESNEDLYFYSQPHVTLKKGDRARYTVFTGKVPYEHIYEWFVPEEMNIDFRGYRQDNNRTEEAIEQVWHSLRLTNETEHPWTTAPAFAVNGSMPVAQDVLKYTPPGGKNTLKLTVATDVRADQAQNEVSRELVKTGYYEYDNITVDGTLTVKNMKQESIQINVKKELTGEVIEANQDGKVSRVAKKLAAVNPQSLLEWEFDLGPGEEQKLTYEYKVLIRR